MGDIAARDLRTSVGINSEVEEFRNLINGEWVRSKSKFTPGSKR
jgi:hypothetical protein